MDNFNPEILKKYDLNLRQAQYLAVIFEQDQENESFNKSLWTHHGTKPRPASEWRWIRYFNYDILSSNSSELCRKMKNKNIPIDQGTGSTFTALAERGMIESFVEGTSTYIKLTRQGRKIARELLGIVPTKKPKISEAKIEALKLCYEAKEDEEIIDTGINNYRNTWMWLIDKGYITEEPASKEATQKSFWNYSGSRFKITSKGRDFYLSLIKTMS